MTFEDDGSPAPVESIDRMLAIGLAAGRIAIGAGLWVAPQRSAKALGFASLDQPGLALARIAGSRDLVLGVAQLGSLADRAPLRRATVCAAAADAADVATFALALGAPETRTAGLRGLPVAALAVVAGAWLASRLR